MKYLNRLISFQRSRSKRDKRILQWSVDVFCKREKVISQQEWLRIVAKELPKKDLSLIEKIKEGLQKLKFLGQ